MAELSDDPTGEHPDRVRAPGGGRKKAEVTNPELVDALDSLIEPNTRGDAEPPLRWTETSTRHLAAALTELAHSISHNSIANLLRSLGYNLPGTRTTREEHQHPDRDDQFRYINTLASEFLASGE
jgi:hypothetical protein